MWGHYFLPLGFPRSDKTQVLSSYQYNDTDDVFAREPFVAQFTLPSKSKRERKVDLVHGNRSGCGWLSCGFVPKGKQKWMCVRKAGSCGSLSFLGFAVLPNVVLVPLHTTPKDVEKELNALYDVFLDVSQRWQNEVGVIACTEEGMVGLSCGKTQLLVFIFRM